MNAALRQTLSPARKICGSLSVRIAGEACVLRCSGAMWVPAHGALIVADLHLEKGSAFAVRGQLLPPYDSRATLDRLEADNCHGSSIRNNPAKARAIPAHCQPRMCSPRKTLAKTSVQNGMV